MGERICSILRDNSEIDVIINFLWKIFHKPIVLVVLTTANLGGGGVSVISARTIHDLRRVKVPGTGPLWNPWMRATVKLSNWWLQLNHLEHLVQQCRNFHWGNCLTKNSFNFFLNKWFTKVSCVSFYVDFAEVVSSCSNRIIVSLFRMLLYVGFTQHYG